MTDVWSLVGKEAVVTGASRGLGRAIAKELAARGARVACVARSTGDLATLVSEVEADGGRAYAVVADLGTQAGIDAVLAAVAERTDVLHALVNNTGINLRKPTLEAPREDWETLVATNVTSAWGLARGLHPALKAAGGASVVQISSVASERAVRTSTAIYAMSKGAMDAMTRFLACEWGKDGIRVNGVAPWYVRTPLGAVVLSDPDKAAAVLARTPLGRVGEPEDIARAVAFLAAPASGWITGVILPVDGGFSALGV